MGGLRRTVVNSDFAVQRGCELFCVERGLSNGATSAPQARQHGGLDRVGTVEVARRCQVRFCTEPIMDGGILNVDTSSGTGLL